MQLTSESSVGQWIGNTDKCLAFERKLIAHGPTPYRNVYPNIGGLGGLFYSPGRQDVRSVFHEKVVDLLRDPFLGIQKRKCGNCHEFSGCQTSGPATCINTPNNPLCGHPETSMVWLNLERLNVLIAVLTGETKNQRIIEDIALIRAYMAVLRAQDGRELHPHFVSIRGRATREEVQKQQEAIWDNSQGLILRTKIRSINLVNLPPMTNIQYRLFQQGGARNFYQKISDRFPHVYDGLFDDVLVA